MANIGGLLKKYINDSEERFFKDIIINEEYKMACNRKADVIIDIGALAGEFGVYMYDKAQMIYCIEPHSKSFEELSVNINDFELTKMKSYNLAIGNFNGIGKLNITYERGGHHLVKGDGYEKTENVKVKTLAKFIKDEKIDVVDILKIDIESTEDEVFLSRDFKKVANKISFIIGEHMSSNLEDLLRNYGFVPKRQERGFTAERIINDSGKGQFMFH